MENINITSPEPLPIKMICNICVDSILKKGPSKSKSFWATLLDGDIIEVSTVLAYKTEYKHYGSSFPVKLRPSMVRLTNVRTGDALEETQSRIYTKLSERITYSLLPS
jgi:hypothetical protein